MGEGVFQPMHLLVILVIALLVFGPRRLGELGKGLGDGVKSFKDAVNGRPDQPAKSEATELAKKD